VSLPAGQQSLRIHTSNAAGGWNFNWFEIVGGSSTQPANQPPTVNAGADQTITLPTSSLSLNGTASDPDGTIASYTWSQVSGPNTATFSSASSASTTVSGLVQGTYVFRLTVKDNQNATATDDVSVTVTAAPATSTSIKIEAEHYKAMFGIKTENTSDVGGGLNVGWQDNNDWMDYSVNMSSAGTYTMNFRVASQFTGPQFQVRNSAGTVLATVTVPNTGGFQTWRTISAQVTLPVGQQTLRIHTSKASGGWNINWFEIMGSGTATENESTGSEVATLGSMDTESALEVYPNPIQDRFTLTVNNNLTGSLKIEMINMSGVVVKTYQLQKTTEGAVQFYLSAAGVATGTYVLKATMQNWTSSTQVVKE
jgi:endoglucanase